MDYKVLKQIIKELIEEVADTKEIESLIDDGSLIVSKISIDGRTPITVNPDTEKLFTEVDPNEAEQSAKKYAKELGANTLDVFFSNNFHKKYVSADEVEDIYREKTNDPISDYWVLFNE